MANTATQPADNWFVIGTASQLQIRYNLKIYDKGLAVMKFFFGGGHRSLEQLKTFAPRKSADSEHGAS